VPNLIKKVLEGHLYLVPPEGLFVCTAAVTRDVACPRDDLVELLVSLAHRHSTLNVAVVHGQRRTGKTFSMPWALAEAGCRLDAGSRRRPLLLYIPCHTIPALGLGDIPLLLSVAVSLCRGHKDAWQVVLFATLLDHHCL
jgi:hypothetical protein